MTETTKETPPCPNDEAAEGYMWVFDYKKWKWEEVPGEIILPTKTTKPDDAWVDKDL